MANPDWDLRRDMAEAQFRAIREECKGRPIKSLRMTPHAAIALRDMFVAAFYAAGNGTSPVSLARGRDPYGCPNCDGVRCIGCVCRDLDHDCVDDCPNCR